MQVLEISRRKYNSATPAQRAEVEERIRKMRKEGERLVKGIFEFVDAGGGWLDFSFRFFKDDPIRTFKIIHGETCELPMLLVKHLNNVYKKIRIPGNNLDKDAPTVTRTSRCRFIPLDMM